MITKICTVCNTEKPLTDFYKNRKGLRADCKMCVIARIEQKCKFYKENPQAIKIPESKLCPQCQKTKKSTDFTKNARKKSGLSWCCKDCTKIKNKILVERYRAKEKTLPKNKKCPRCQMTKAPTEFYKSKPTPDGLHGFCKMCCGLNNKENRERINKAERERNKRNVNCRIKHLLRSRISDALKRKSKTKKNCRTTNLLGCSVEECLKHLENLFWPGMTFENMCNDGWHLDHVIPLDSFDLTNLETQKIAFHYTNIQPLWSDDNHIKTNRLDWTPAESKHPLPDRLAHFKTPNTSDLEPAQ